MGKKQKKDKPSSKKYQMYDLSKDLAEAKKHDVEKAQGHKPSLGHTFPGKGQPWKTQDGGSGNGQGSCKKFE